MKAILTLLLLGAMIYLGLQLEKKFGDPIREAIGEPDPVAAYNYEAQLSRLQNEVFSPLSNSSRAIQLGPLLQQLNHDVEAGRLSSSEEAGLRRQINALQQALQERNRFTSNYRTIGKMNNRSFDEDFKARRIKLHQQAIERRWAEESKRLEAAYERSQFSR